MTRHDPAHEIELYRDEDVYVVYGDLPGFDPDEMEVRWHDRRLSISAERYDPDHERRFVVHRSLSVPHEINEEAIAASYDGEILEVHLPIVNGGEKPGRRIDISR